MGYLWMTWVHFTRIMLSKLPSRAPTWLDKPTYMTPLLLRTPDATWCEEETYSEVRRMRDVVEV